MEILKKLHYELWFYNVWGNFEVWDKYCVDPDFAIMLNFTNRQIIQILVDCGHLKKSVLTNNNIEINRNSGNIYLVDVDLGFCLCGLILTV